MTSKYTALVGADPLTGELTPFAQLPQSYGRHLNVTGSLALNGATEMHYIAMTGATTLTVTGGRDGDVVGAHIVTGGLALTIGEVTSTADGFYGFYRVEGAWYPLGAATGVGGGGTDPGGGDGGGTTIPAGTYKTYTASLSPDLSLNLESGVTNTGSAVNEFPAKDTRTIFTTAGLTSEFAHSASFGDGTGPNVDGVSIDGSTISFTNAITVMLLVRVTGGTSYGALISGWQSETACRIEVGNTTSGAMTVAIGGGSSATSATGAVPLGTVVLVGLRYDGTRITGWINGSAVAGKDFTATLPSKAISTAARGCYVGEQNGLRVWSKALTDAQMLGAAQAAGLA